MQRDSKASLLRGRSSDTQEKKGFSSAAPASIVRLHTDVCCDTEPGVATHLHKKEKVKSAAELEMSVEVTSDQLEGQGCSL